MSKFILTTKINLVYKIFQRRQEERYKMLISFKSLTYSRSVGSLRTCALKTNLHFAGFEVNSGTLGNENTTEKEKNRLFGHLKVILEEKIISSSLRDE